MIATDWLVGIVFSFLLAILGAAALGVTRNNRSSHGVQVGILLVAFAVRFSMSIVLYGFGLNEQIVGDGDDSGWFWAVKLKETWAEQGLGVLGVPVAMLGAFDGTNKGYRYLLAAYFCITRVPSRLSAAGLNCLCGGMTAVFVYRIARVHFSEWVAVRAGWWTCFFPGMIIWSAQTVKEPVVILLETVALYGCLRLRADGFRFKYIVLSSAAVVVLASLRFYAAYVAGGTILLTLIMPQSGRGKMSTGSALGMGAVVISLLFYSGALVNHQSEFEKWDIPSAEQFRRDIAAGTGSGVEMNHDMNTTRGLGMATFVGAAHLLLAPFPWQLGGGSLRMLLTLPEQVVWWYLFFGGVVPGFRHAIRYRFGDVMPLLLFVVGLAAIYSLTFGNVGVVYRQRSQLLPYLLIFAAVGLERRRPAPSRKKGSTPCPPVAA